MVRYAPRSCSRVRPAALRRSARVWVAMSLRDVGLRSARQFTAGAVARAVGARLSATAVRLPRAESPRPRAHIREPLLGMLLACPTAPIAAVPPSWGSRRSATGAVVLSRRGPSHADPTRALQLLRSDPRRRRSVRLLRGRGGAGLHGHPAGERRPRARRAARPLRVAGGPAARARHAPLRRRDAPRARRAHRERGGGDEHRR